MQQTGARRISSPVYEDIRTIMRAFLKTFLTNIVIRTLQANKRTVRFRDLFADPSEVS